MGFCLGDPKLSVSRFGLLRCMQCIRLFSPYLSRNKILCGAIRTWKVWFNARRSVLWPLIARLTLTPIASNFTRAISNSNLFIRIFSHCKFILRSLDIRNNKKKLQNPHPFTEYKKHRNRLKHMHTRTRTFIYNYIILWVLSYIMWLLVGLVIKYFYALGLERLFL